MSNLLSISRAAMAIPFAFVMLAETPSSRLWGGVIMVAAALTDKFDGVLARKYNQITQWGRVLDPIADKIAVGTVAIVLLALGNIPVWFVAAVLARDALIFSGGMYVRKKKGVILESNEAGKWAVGIVSLALFLMVLNAQSVLVDISLLASVALLVVSFAMYLMRFKEVMKG
jgi:CDP-diacylglycerol--glycerol-3-phosphate 3-phosphatidyltransferase